MYLLNPGPWTDLGTSKNLHSFLDEDVLFWTTTLEDQTFATYSKQSKKNLVDYKFLFIFKFII